MNKEKKFKNKVKNNNLRAREFFEIDKITDNFLLTTKNEEIYFVNIQPKNISLLSDKGKENIISDLSDTLSAFPQCEIICLDDTQNFESNKDYFQKLCEKEPNLTVKDLDEKDITFLDDIKLSMATSRSFFIAFRKKNSIDSAQQRLQDINIAIQTIKQHNFDALLANKNMIKKMFAVYLEQNIYKENFEDYDGQQYGVDDKSFNLKDYVDLVVPSIFDFKHPTYYCIGNTYRTTWAVRSYATKTERLALLKDLGEKDGVTLHIYNRQLSTGEQDKIFNSASKRNHFSLVQTKDVNERVKGVENQTDLQKLISESHKTKEIFGYCAVYIEMSATSLEKLREIQKVVDTILSRAHILVDKLRLQQRDGFICSSPFGFNIFKSEFERVLPTSSVANLFPFSYSGKTDKFGSYIGKDSHGSNLIVDFIARALDKTNSHVSVFGNSGEGKSYLLKLLICIFRQIRKSIYSLDVDSEYIDLTDNLGGTNLDMLEGKYYINPLEPKIISSNDDNEDNNMPPALKRNTVLSQHIAFLKDFFCVYKPELTSAQLDILEIMLTETYKRFHITDNTSFSELSPEQFPILSDVYKTTEDALNSYDDAAHKGLEMIYAKSDLRLLLLALNSICLGTDSRFFNGYTNIPNADHINFIITGLLYTNVNLKNAMYFNILSFMQHKYFTEGNTVVVADELHELINTSIVINHLRSFIKRGRKRESCVVIASQNIDDLMLPGIIEYTRPLFSIPTHSFLFFPGKVNIKQFIDITNITEAEFSIINRSHQGKCLYCCGNERYELEVIAPSYKSCLFGTAGGR